MTNPAVYFDTTGTYNTTLTATSGKGCIGEGNNVINVADVKLDFIASYISGCSPVCVEFEALESTSHGEITLIEWHFSDSTSYTGKYLNKCFENLSTSEIISIDVSVNIANSIGCTEEYSRLNLIEIWPNPRADFESEIYASTIDKAEFDFISTSEGADHYEWSFGDGTTSNEENPSHTFTEMDTYAVQLYIFNDYNCSDNIMIPFKIEPVNNIYIPNAFTPQEDGINDFFKPVFRVRNS